MLSSKLFRPLLLVGAGLALIVGLSFSSVLAQEEELAPGSGLRINPVRQEFILNQGETRTYEIEVTNVTGGPLSISTVLNDFESNNESGEPKILTNTDDRTPYTLVNFVTLPELFELEPGETENVLITVKAPDDISPGGYFGLVRFGAGLKDVDPSTVLLSASVGSILIVNVPGEVNEGMSLNFIEARKDGEGGRFFESSPDSIAISLDNTGNSVLKPFGRVTVKNMFGSEVFTYELNSKSQVRSNVLPKSSRTFTDAVNNLGRIGKYTVETNISYGEGGGNIITANASFWIIPWKIILAVVAVVTAIAWTSTSGIRIYNRKVVERSKKKN